MSDTELLPHLFRTEYSKITAVLCRLFGLEYIETAEDIVSDTFLLAAETWGLKGLPANPVAWLYTVAKNKALDFLKHNEVFNKKVAAELKQHAEISYELKIDLSVQNINDSQLQMMFAICHPAISTEAQIGLSLNILCGFGAEEIADAFLSNKETIYKRLSRAKEKLRQEKIKMELPPQQEIHNRLETVLTTIYLLFSEGYYSTSQNTTLRKDFCVEAMRLNLMLLDNESTNSPSATALLSLMCFHASRFEARVNAQGDIILYEEQDETLWNTELIDKGKYYLNLASTGNKLSRYHLEAAIAYWHTHKKDSKEKWENILQLYNRLLQLEYSPVAALNRTYALSKANSKEEAITEAEKLGLEENHLYHSLLGNLYSGMNNFKARLHYEKALSIAKTNAEKKIILNNLEKLSTT
ncbi:MAG: DUF6596 domain-containing protein [Bacteroidota bacterium]